MSTLLRALSAVFFFAIPCLAQNQSVTFTFEPNRIGQQIEQTTTTRSRLHTTYEQSRQIISSDTKDETIKQLRTVVLLEKSPIPSARVTYKKAVKQRNGRFLARATAQPVQGKTYVVRRVNDQLEITYPNGGTPPPAELGIVRVNMQSVGKPNPLASFLDGRSVAVGETVTLPESVGSELLGSWLGKHALPVTLKMVKVQQTKVGSRTESVATFELRMTSRTPDGTPSVSSMGQVTVGVMSCRTLRLQMNADVNLKDQRGPAGAQFTVANVGQVELSMAADYVSAITSHP